jgi:hypothetical protein
MMQTRGRVPTATGSTGKTTSNPACELRGRGSAVMRLVLLLVCLLAGGGMGAGARVTTLLSQCARGGVSCRRHGAGRRRPHARYSHVARLQRTRDRFEQVTWTISESRMPRNARRDALWRTGRRAGSVAVSSAANTPSKYILRRMAWGPMTMMMRGDAGSPAKSARSRPFVTSVFGGVLRSAVVGDAVCIDFSGAGSWVLDQLDTIGRWASSSFCGVLDEERPCFETRGRPSNAGASGGVMVIDSPNH